MKNFFVFITLTYFISACSPFSKLAKESKVETVNGYVRVFNPKVNLSNLNFGDVRFAFTKKEYKLLNPKTKPSFKNILLYGKTITAPFYNYYILQETNDLSVVLHAKKTVRILIRSESEIINIWINWTDNRAEPCFYIKHRITGICKLNNKKPTN